MLLIPIDRALETGYGTLRRLYKLVSSVKTPLKYFPITLSLDL